MNPIISNTDPLDGKIKLEKNLGWLYNKDYFSVLYPLNNQPGSNNFTGKNRMVTSFQFPKNSSIENILPLAEHHFTLTTCYPGLIIGTGRVHATGIQDSDEYKLGLEFDYTTGLPVLPASSVKGLLRGVFPMSKPKQDDEQTAEKEYREPRRKYIVSLLKEHGITFQTEDIDRLEDAIFEGISNDSDSLKKAIPIYQRDLFFDGFPFSAKGKLLDSDYITPHKDPLENPIPIQFLKIMPEVQFCFNFRLTDTKIRNQVITAKQKKQLFKQILLDLGIGAKTNVGYGKFKE